MFPLLTVSRHVERLERFGVLVLTPSVERSSE
jgi:hypothetical protein